MHSVDASHFQPFQAIMAVADDPLCAKFPAVVFHDLSLFFRRMRHKLSDSFTHIMFWGKFRISGRLCPVERRAAELGTITVLLRLDDLYMHLPKQASHCILFSLAVLCSPAVL